MGYDVAVTAATIAGVALKYDYRIAVSSTYDFARSLGEVVAAMIVLGAVIAVYQVADALLVRIVLILARLLL